jgi:hypothetical protein
MWRLFNLIVIWYFNVPPSPDCPEEEREMEERLSRRGLTIPSWVGALIGDLAPARNSAFPHGKLVEAAVSLP